MNNIAFEAYGNLANIGTDPLLQAGRLPQHVEAERRILADVLAKLRPQPTDSLLEVGCGPGSLAIPLSFLMRQVVAMDHEKVVARGAERYSAPNLAWVGGEFPSDAPRQKFDCILVYSVLHYLPDDDAIVAFCSAAADMLNPGGRLLLGDLPNGDRKARFLASEAGKAFDAAWRAGTLPQGEVASGATLSVPNGANMIGVLSDALVMRILAQLRVQGCHSYVLAQPAMLPFGHTREDILVERL